MGKINRDNYFRLMILMSILVSLAVNLLWTVIYYDINDIAHYFG